MYKPKIKVVRKMGANSWYLDDGRYRSAERAYLVRGLPMPGERVVVPCGDVFPMLGLEVRLRVDGLDYFAEAVRPHDPDAERLRVATEAVERQFTEDLSVAYEAIARAVLDALKEVDDG